MNRSPKIILIQLSGSPILVDGSKDENKLVIIFSSFF